MLVFHQLLLNTTELNFYLNQLLRQIFYKNQKRENAHARYTNVKQGVARMARTLNASIVIFCLYGFFYRFSTGIHFYFSLRYLVCSVFWQYLKAGHF